MVDGEVKLLHFKQENGMMNTFEGFPLIVGWELTLACNLRCRHCASSAGEPRPNELTLDESLAICDQLPELLTVEVVFTGGEPLISAHWEPIASRLSQHGIRVGMVTNGIGLSPETLIRLQAAGIKALAISLDGREKTHDFLRGVPGLHRRLVSHIQRVVAAGFKVTVITTVHSRNVRELEGMLPLLRSLGAQRWQLQPIFGFGRTRESRDLLLSEDEYLLLGRFVQDYHPIAHEWGLEICPADGVGYFSEIEVPGPVWQGCSAGIATCGITSDGRVKGCLSWPDSFVEGDLRQDDLWTIWFRPNAFAQTRGFLTQHLGAGCLACDMGEQCRGGCNAISYAARGTFHADPYCYRSILARRASAANATVKIQPAA